MKRLTTILALLSTISVHGQIILENEQWGGGVITTTDQIYSPMQEEDTSGIIFDWQQTLKDFEKFDGAKELDKISVSDDSGYRHIQINGLNIPEIIDENGVDLFLLTKDGIAIYMATDAPIYLQDIDDNVVKWIRYYGYQKRAYTKRLFGRYEKWEQIIKEEFNKRGVPQELAELCLIESGCTYEAVSPIGAVGMWQITPETGRHYKMTINQFLDERKDPYKSTVIAGRILESNYKKIGEWTLAIAAYNCGAGRILEQIKKGNGSWDEIQTKLPKETQQYIPRLMAIHYIWTYRDKLQL